MSDLAASQPSERRYPTGELVRRPLSLAWQIRGDCLLSLVMSLALAIIAQAFVRAYLTYEYKLVTARLTQGKLVPALRGRLYAKLQRLSFRFFDVHGSSSIFNRVTGDVQNTRMLVDGVEGQVASRSSTRLPMLPPAAGNVLAPHNDQAQGMLLQTEGVGQGRDSLHAPTVSPRQFFVRGFGIELEEHPELSFIPSRSLLRGPIALTCSGLFCYSHQSSINLEGGDLKSYLARRKLAEPACCESEGKWLLQLSLN